MIVGSMLALALAAGPRIAVMPIAPGASIPADQAASLTETLAAELRQQSGSPVVTSRDLTTVLSLEKQKQALGCTTDSCMAEIAGAAGAERLVTGDVSRLGESLLVQLRLLDARTASVLVQSHRRFRKGGFDDLLDALPAMVGELLVAPPPPARAAASPAAPAASAAPRPPAASAAPATPAAPAAPQPPGTSPARWSWTTAAPLPEPRSGVAAAALDGKLYVLGGWLGRALATAQVYDPGTGAWRTLAPMPTARTEAVAAVVGGRILLLGGWTGTFSDAVEEYDPATNRWTQRARMPTARSSLTGAVLDGRVYLFGGGAYARARGDVGPSLAYDPAADRWTSRAPSPVLRYRATAATLGGKVYVIGGEIPPAGWVDVYDPVRDRWDRTAVKANLPSPHYWQAAAVVAGRICVLGWLNEVEAAATAKAFGSVECYEPGADRWIAAPPLPTPRYAAGAAAIGDALYVVGGNGPSGAEPAVHVLRP